MKILYIANSESIHTKRWLTWFIKKGHKVYLITPAASDIKGIEKEYILPFKKKGGIIPRPLFVFKIKKIIRNVKPDILHCHYMLGAGIYGALVNFHPYVLTGWGGDIAIQPYKSVFKRFLVKYNVKKSDYVTVFSKYLVDHLNKLNIKPKNLEIIVPWEKNISEHKYKEKLKQLSEEINAPPNSFIVVSPRNMQPLYRIDRIIDCIPSVIEKHPNTIFVFLKGLADENYYEKILATVEKYSIQNNVRIISRWLNDEEMAALHTLSNVMISIPIMDQFAITVREAMVYGSIPIIGDLEIYRTIFTDKNAFFVSGENSKEIASIIVEIIENPIKMNNIIKGNKDFIKQHEAIEKKLDEMERIYIQLLKK